MNPRAVRLPLPEIACGLSVAVLTALLTVPGTLARWWLTQDAVEHLAIANAWVAGAGFVDPVKWIYWTDGALPYPALSMRAPAVSLLAAIPLGLGATLTTTIAMHALWASAIAAFMVPAARRCGLRWPAGLAATLLLATTPAWLGISLHVWTEATALFAFLLVLLTARGAVRSVPGALLCATTTFAASLCRPNLIALGLSVIVAGAWQIGWRRAHISRPLIAYGLALSVALLGFRLLVTLWTGEAPYSRYQSLFQVMTTADAWQYGRSYPGLSAFVADHAAELAERTATTVVDFVRVLCLEPTYHGLGWLALPGFVWAFARDGEHAIERRFLALSGLGLALVAVFYVDFDRVRFPLFTAVAANLCGVAWLDDLARGAQRARWATRTVWQRALHGAPLALACIPLFMTLPGSIDRAAAWWTTYRTHGTAERLWPEMDALIRPLCREMDPDEIVASIDPWTTHLWCGNASLMLPLDLSRKDILESFLERERPRYIVAPADHPGLRDSRLLSPLVRRNGLVVYRVSRASGDSRPWRAPPPLACAGRTSTCQREVGH